jgi:hypothetical protein
VPRHLALTVHQQVEPVFERVLSTSVHKFRYLRPFFRTFKLQDILEQPTVFLERPGSLLDVGVEKTVPMFTALFWCSKNFVFVGVALI